MARDGKLTFLAHQQMRRPPRRTSTTVGNWPGITGGPPRLVIVDLYIEDCSQGGRNLVARYHQGGGDDLEIVDGLREFKAGIPDDWDAGRVLRLIDRPTVRESPYDSWEAPSRMYGCVYLFDDDTPESARK